MLKRLQWHRLARRSITDGKMEMELHIRCRTDDQPNSGEK
jgi:hypothetical protein